MKTNEEYDDEPIADIPPSPLLKVVRRCRTGEEDKDAVEWREVQRLVIARDWEPVLRLPRTGRDDFLWPPGQWEE